jgi:Peptidase family M20/M25/M40
MPAGPRRYLPRAARATIPPMRDLLDRLDGWRDEQIEFLARLVNHDSGTDDVVDVNGVGAILAERLERLGFAVRRVVNDRFGDHLVGDKPGSGPKRFLFVGHYDTVFPSGTAKQRPFRIDPQGRAWGPGVYDMKGGLAAVLYAMRAHREARTRTWEECADPTARPVGWHPARDGDEPSNSHRRCVLGIQQSSRHTRSMCIRSPKVGWHEHNPPYCGLPDARTVPSKLEHWRLDHEPAAGQHVSSFCAKRDFGFRASLQRTILLVGSRGRSVGRAGGGTSTKA